MGRSILRGLGTGAVTSLAGLVQSALLRLDQELAWERAPLADGLVPSLFIITQVVGSMAYATMAEERPRLRGLFFAGVGSWLAFQFVRIVTGLSSQSGLGAALAFSGVAFVLAFALWHVVVIEPRAPGPLTLR